MDPYAILGVSRDASPDEIKQAFRRLAREHHPDRNPDDDGAKKRFQEINSAYQLLSDPKNRAHFDRFGAEPAARPAGARDGFGGFGRGGGFSGGVNFEDLFGDFFRGAGFSSSSSRHQAVSRDVERVVELSFEEAALGCTKTVEYERYDLCDSCGGDGAKAGSHPSPCKTCGGRGKVTMTTIGIFSVAAERPCPSCDGRGTSVQTPCDRCAGKGVYSRKRRVEVTVPPGIEHGAKQTVSRAGNRMNRAQPAGDLELLISVTRHAAFRREGDDVLSELQVPFSTAALGGKLSVRTLHGETELDVPAGTQPGAWLRLREQGVPHRFRRGRGDHRFRVKVTLPENLSPRAEQLIKELDQTLKEQDASVFSRIKDWFG